MKLYFTLKSIPQFAHLSKSEQRSRYRHYYRKFRWHWLVWLPMLTFMIGFVALLELADNLVGIGNALLIGGLYVLIAAPVHNAIVYGFIASRLKEDED